MQRILVALVAVVVLVTMATPGVAQPINPCVGGCDAEYIPNYDVQYMWNTYGYPTYYDGCWWYDVGDEWWYMCPNGPGPHNNLYVWQG